MKFQIANLKISSTALAAANEVFKISFVEGH